MPLYVVGGAGKLGISKRILVSPIAITSPLFQEDKISSETYHY